MPPGYSVYSGDDALTLPMLSVGAVGVVSVASHLVGPQIAAMIDFSKKLAAPKNNGPLIEKILI